MLIGYIRYVPDGTDETKQIRILIDRGADKIFTERTGVRHADPKARQNLIDYVREGDTVLVDSLKTFADATEDFLRVLEQLIDHGAALAAITDGIEIDARDEEYRGLMLMLRARPAVRPDTGFPVASLSGKTAAMKYAEVLRALGLDGRDGKAAAGSFAEAEKKRPADVHAGFLRRYGRQDGLTRFKAVRNLAASIAARGPFPPPRKEPRGRAAGVLSRQDGHAPRTRSRTPAEAIRTQRPSVSRPHPDPHT